MKSMKKRIIALILCFAMLIPSLCVGVFAYEVPNDLKGHWAEKEVYTLITEDIIAGYNDGSFKPNNSITRAEFCKLVIETLVKYEVISYSNKTNTFTDVPQTEWFSKYVETAYEYDIVSGVGENKFEPKSPVTREQMSKILVNVYCQLFGEKFSDISNPAVTTRTFKDYDKISSWALPYVSAAYNVSLMKGSDGNFDPAKPTTRAEAGTAIFRLFDFSYAGLLRLDNFVYMFNAFLKKNGYTNLIADFKQSDEGNYYYFVSNKGNINFFENEFDYTLSFEVVMINDQAYIDKISLLYIPTSNFSNAPYSYAELYTTFLFSSLPFINSDSALETFKKLKIAESFNNNGFNEIFENITYNNVEINFSCDMDYLTLPEKFDYIPYGTSYLTIEFNLK